MDSAAEIALSIAIVSAWLAGWWACGFFTSRIFKRKNRDPGKGWVVGLIFGIWGVLFATLLQPRLPEVMRTVQCPHCRAYQDVPAWSPCWTATSANTRSRCPG